LSSDRAASTDKDDVPIPFPVAIIFNPVSGRKKSTKIVIEIEQQLVDRGHRVRVIPTPKNTADLEQECNSLDPSTRVIVVGGDGTLNLFLRYARHDHPVAFYGTGTANVIALEHGLPRRVEKFMEMLERDHQVSCPIGEVDTGQPFIMMWSCGFDGAVLHRVSQASKNRLGKLAFLIATVRAMFGYKFQKFRVEIEDQIEEASFVLVSHIRHYGGPFQMFPDRSDEGKLRVLLFDGSSLLSLTGFILALLSKRVHRLKRVRYFHADKIKLHDPPQGTYCQVDGDLCHGFPSVIRYGTRRFRLIVPSLSP